MMRKPNLSSIANCKWLFSDQAEPSLAMLAWAEQLYRLSAVCSEQSHSLTSSSQTLSHVNFDFKFSFFCYV